MSFDYQAYNVVGYFLYSLYNLCFFYNAAVQRAYKREHDGSSNLVALTDVMFAVHALVLTGVLVSQIFIYERGAQHLSKFCIFVCSLSLGVTALYALVVLIKPTGKVLSWLFFLYWCSGVKVGITLIKYVPQIYMNWRRKSTVGVNIHNFILDFMGGFLSITQLVMDAVLAHDGFGAVVGNFSKFGLGVLAICFDIVYLVQHYILYPDRYDHALAHNRLPAPLMYQSDESTGTHDALLRGGSIGGNAPAVEDALHDVDSDDVESQ
jgi:cystinosin